MKKVGGGGASGFGEEFSGTKGRTRKGASPFLVVKKGQGSGGSDRGRGGEGKHVHPRKKKKPSGGAENFYGMEIS